jgi:hypothetical protein
MKKMKLLTKLVVCLATPVFVGPPALAVEDAVKVDQEQEGELAQKVKKRDYPGGKDESEVKVQATLSKPTRKISPTVEETPESSSDE